MHKRRRQSSESLLSENSSFPDEKKSVLGKILQERKSLVEILLHSHIKKKCSGNYWRWSVVINRGGKLED
jgi:hypothetical protein